MRKVLVLMSGGIDSSVAAALLKKEGFEVIGAFMRLANLPRFDEAKERAKKVAKILKIPFYVFNLEKEFKKKIIDYFLKEYKAGNTPNPCVLCNKEIKFGLLLEKALKLDADFVATGHYVRKIQNSKIKMQNENLKCKIFKLLRAKDKSKDQSYFLWMLNQEQLKRILFPIGSYTKEEVRNFAKKFKLPVLKAKKSVEICFIEKTVNEFLKKYLKKKSGLIVEKISGKNQKKHSNILQNVRILDGYRILGKHEGLWFYTIGQRKGIGLSGGPFWVLEKNLEKNLLIVTRNEKDLLKGELFCKNVNWISGREPRPLGEARPFGAAKLPLKVKAKIRYRQELADATVYPTFAHLRKCANIKNKIYKVIFKKPQRAITPGQSVVFYKGEEVLGGGIICNPNEKC
jgi:tRNA-specific 2-thiouridylase